jgi:hypothetical protein
MEAVNQDNIKIEDRGRSALIMDGDSAFTFEVSENPRDFNTYRAKQDSLDWNDLHFNVDGWRILPYGDNNDLPREIQEAVQNNSYAPGMLEKIVMLLWGKGPYVYKERKEGENVYRDLVDDPELDAWLKSWEYNDYLLRCAETYSYVQGGFTKFYTNRAARLGKPAKIAKLEHVGVECSRLANLYVYNSAIPTHVVETDFSFNSINSLTDMKVYPIFDIKNPFAAKTSMYYSNKYTFGSKNYTVPKIYGSLEWLRRSTAIPLILKALSKNSINIKYHVISPQEFWDEQEDRIKENCNKTGETYNDSMLDEYKQNLLKGISKVLGSEENTGKFWHTTTSFTVEGNNLIEHGWVIKAIDQNLKDFVGAQIEISEHAIKNLSTGIGLNAAMANSSESGKANSGSEQLYADKNHKTNSNPIPEMIVCRPFNMALDVNFPGKGYKVGFLQVMPERQQDLSVKDRAINEK